MTERPRLPDFNAPRAPTAAKLTRFFTGLLWLLVGTQVGASLTNLAASILIAIAVSRPLRSGHGFWLELLLVALFFGAMSLIGWLGIRSMKSKWFSALYSGRPRFGSLKGPGKQGFQFILRCSGSMNLRFEPEIDRLIRKTALRTSFRSSELTTTFMNERASKKRGGPTLGSKFNTPNSLACSTVRPFAVVDGIYFGLNITLCLGWYYPFR